MKESEAAADALNVVRIGHAPDVWGSVDHVGVELAAWQRDPDPAWADWLALVMDLPAGHQRLMDA